MTGSTVTKSLLARALGEVSEGAVLSDAAGTVLYANAAFTRITGFEPAEIVGTELRFLQGPSTSPAEVQRMRDALDAAEVFQGTLLHYRKDGTSFWNHLTITPLKDDSGTLTHVVSVHRDVTDIVEERKKLTNAASHDLLTGLPNGAALRRHLRSEFGAAAEDGSVVALGLIDLDDFKLVNDQHGREAGDAVLVQFAARLSEVLRRGDYVARLGGDEFVVVISDLAPTDPSGELGGILDRIHTAVERPFDIGGSRDGGIGGGTSVPVSMSMGIALFPSDGVAGRDLLRTADAVLYRVKSVKTAGGSGSWWEVARPEDAVSTDSVAESMGAVSLSGDLVMYMQPIVELHTGRVGQVEALARIRRPDGSMEPPESFLPYFSRKQLVELFIEGLDQSLAWVARWESVGVELNVSVNIPAELLNAPDSADWVRDALTRHSLPPHRLSLELLETQELDLSTSDRTVAELVRLGVKIHLDDLSSGFSTLKRITDIPFDVIKIDRRIFERAHTRPLQVLIVVAAITALGTEAGYGVVVEGIEDRERLEVSVAVGAEFGQGYLFARPMPPEDIAQWVGQFTMPHPDGEVTTALGALAYHWTHSRDVGETHPSREECPLTTFFAHADARMAELHDSLHTAAGARGPANAEITAWLVGQVQNRAIGDWSEV